MNFTREPIIETIISPKEGYKLLVRSSKGENGEEYYVDAVEVVSFGRAFFFRSMERPKAFLVPVSDYEVLEVKEARVALKNASHEKSIKIGGGKEAPMRPAQREHREPPASSEAESSSEEVLETAVDSRMDHRKRDRRRHRRRRGHEERSPEQKTHEAQPEGKEHLPEEESKGAVLFSTLIPPPPTLISETLSRYREKEQESEAKKEQPKPEDRPEEDPGAESSTLQRVSTKETELHSPYFIPFTGGPDSFF